jgi:hypothetical protein
MYKVISVLGLWVMFLTTTAFGPTCTCCGSRCADCCYETGVVLNEIELAVIGGVTPVIATTLQCSNPSAIRTTLAGLIGKAGFTTASTTTIPSNVKPPYLNLNLSVCSVFAEIVVGAITSEIPVSWGCSAAVITSLTTTLLTDACTSL